MSQPPIKIVYLVDKRQDLSDEAFVEHWTTVHAQLALTLPNLVSYAINLPSTEQRGARPLDGFAALEFPSWADAKAAWASPAGQATAEDGRLFMARARPLIVSERVVLPPPVGEP